MNAASLLLLLAIIVMVIVVNPIIIRLTIRHIVNPEVWGGAFDIVLDDGSRIPGSFKKEYGINGIDIPKGRLITKIVLKGAVKGFVPMISLHSCIGKFSTQLVSGLPLHDDQTRSDLEFQVINPTKLPKLVKFAVCSNQRIAGGEERATKGLFFPERDLNLWYRG